MFHAYFLKANSHISAESQAITMDTYLLINNYIFLTCSNTNKNNIQKQIFCMLWSFSSQFSYSSVVLTFTFIKKIKKQQQTNKTKEEKTKQKKTEREFTMHA